MRALEIYGHVGQEDLIENLPLHPKNSELIKRLEDALERYTLCPYFNDCAVIEDGKNITFFGNFIEFSLAFHIVMAKELPHKGLKNLVLKNMNSEEFKRAVEIEKEDEVKYRKSLRGEK